MIELWSAIIWFDDIPLANVIVEKLLGGGGGRLDLKSEELMCYSTLAAGLPQNWERVSFRKIKTVKF